MPTPTAVSWSGGKDCCLALHRAREAGFEVRYLLAMFDETGERTRSHAVLRAVMQAQAEALGMELVAPSASWGDYEGVFVGALKGLRERGVGDVVFGDIDLQPHRDWEEKVCAAAGVAPHLPLWQEERTQLAREVLERGYRPLVVCTDDRHLDATWCGRPYDAAYVASLPPGVDACGEKRRVPHLRHRRPAVPLPRPRRRRGRRHARARLRRQDVPVPLRPPHTRRRLTSRG
jgi:uncharacterized protein (TIGR00290 family)